MKNRVLSCRPFRAAGYLILLLSIPLVVVFANGNSIYASDDDHDKQSSSGHKSGDYGDRYSQSILRGVKLSDVFTYNDTKTTDFGPAYANVWTASSNFLACSPPSGRPFSYALCYYSGPDAPTGNQADNPSLPCTLSSDGVLANCTCIEIPTEVPSPKIPYFVDINAISNLDIYQKTVEACGKQGENCFMTGRIPPVCEAINTNLLVPGADLISVFSPVLIRDYQTGGSGEETSTDCTKKRDQSIYAGCMTAPCYRTGVKDAAGYNLVECKCPVYDGPFQIGQGGQSCNANDPPPSTSYLRGKKPHNRGDNVWSAAYNPAGGPILITNAECIPDSPQNGCDLFDSTKNYNINPGEALCQSVCKHYENSTPSGKNNPNNPEIQVAYSCDATLCTTLGIGQGDGHTGPGPTEEFKLLSKACNGIQNIQGLTEITLVEELAKCSCCASQICGCANNNVPNALTNQEIYNLNAEQRAFGITPQCDIPNNNTLCGSL
jgi:hypothetical protein